MTPSFATHLDLLFGYKQVEVETREINYTFLTHFHPFVVNTRRTVDNQIIEGLATRLVRDGVKGLLSADTDTIDGAPFADVVSTDADAELYDGDFFAEYLPQTAVAQPYPVKKLAYEPGDIMARFNLEWMLMVPLAIGTQLSADSHFEAADRWLRLLFDPTDTSNGPEPGRYFKVLGLQASDLDRATDLIRNLLTGDGQEKTAAVNAMGAAWANPFDSWEIAMHNRSALQQKLVFTFLDNQMAWANRLFMSDTPAAINKALTHYFLILQILGARPQRLPRHGTVVPRTYETIRQGLAEQGPFALAAFETEIPFADLPVPGESPGGLAPIDAGAQSVLYFCSPPDRKVQGYIDEANRRVFNIRHSLNFAGEFRRLDAFTVPDLDSFLGRAAASEGIDAILAGANQPLPLVRFEFLLGRALELANEVRSLGGALLSAIEGHDQSRLEELRSTHERALLDTTESVRYGQWQEARKQRESMVYARDSAVNRYVHFSRLLGMSLDDIEIPEMDELEIQELLEGQLRVQEPTMGHHDIDYSTAYAGLLSPIAGFFTGGGLDGFFTGAGIHLNTSEAWGLRLRALSEAAYITSLALRGTGATLEAVPNTKIAAHYWGIGMDIEIPGPQKLATASSKWSDFFSATGDFMAREGGRSETVGSLRRRTQQWREGQNATADEINQIHKQLRAAQIREFVTGQEYKAHRLQMEQAEEIDAFLTNERKGQTTNKDFYQWLRRETQALHRQSLDLAYGVAKQAELALRHLLGESDRPPIIKYDYGSGKEGLLAGEKLALDLRRMENAYHLENRREVEWTEVFSLQQLDPLALLQLRTTGKCTFHLHPDALTSGGPHLYFHRIVDVTWDVPHTRRRLSPLSLTARLMSSTIRRDASVVDGYERTGPDDPRFDDHFGLVESVVISTGEADRGIFPPDSTDQRRPPFYRFGVDSKWELELPWDPTRGEPGTIDPNGIQDVYMTVRMTARDGGPTLRAAAMNHFMDRIAGGAATGQVRVFAVKHEFPTEWAQFKAMADGSQPAAELLLDMRPEHYPYWSTGRLNHLTRLQVVAGTTAGNIRLSPTPDVPADGIDLASSPTLGPLLIGDLDASQLAPVGAFSLFADPAAVADIEELYLLATWSG